MTERDNEWSVASVFCTLPTCHSIIGDVGPLPQVRPGAFDFRDHHVHGTLFAPLVEIDNPRKNVESVAGCIRQLGYTVQCGAGGQGRRGKYSILSISKKKFYYGSEFGTCYQNLSGKRTVYEGFLLRRPSWRAALVEHARGFATEEEIHQANEKKMIKLIDDGSICNKNWENWDIWETSVSTIGNTLPNDIVHALQDFRSDCPSFVRNPDREFYIPPSMQETPDACPPPEPVNNQGGGAQATAVATVEHGAVVAVQAEAASKKTPNTSESSDSSDSEDDD